MPGIDETLGNVLQGFMSQGYSWPGGVAPAAFTPFGMDKTATGVPVGAEEVVTRRRRPLVLPRGKPWTRKQTRALMREMHYQRKQARQILGPQSDLRRDYGKGRYRGRRGGRR